MKNIKYFIGHKDNDYKIKLLILIFPSMMWYRKDFDEVKYMSFLMDH